MARRSEAADADDERLAVREAAALTSRQWVRLTRCCNNRCAFCLDADVQDGTMRSLDEVLADLAEGRRLGRRRLVLSGGEPTIHPAFLDVVRAGAEAGYDRVQVVSNGRMFARATFLRDAVRAGLGELTCSLHGPTAELHDRLVGVRGAFAQTLRGLRNALAVDGLVVNVDVVVCGANVGVVDRIVSLCRRLGVREFDLLQVQPAGRAAHDEAMLYDVAPAMASLARVFELARPGSGLFLWTNRFPVRHLEGFEELIQDPHKLVDEVRGRYEHVAALLEEGRSLPCRAADGGRLCAACYLSPLCDELHLLAAKLVAGDFDEALFDLREDRPGLVPPRLGRSVRRSRVLATDIATARRMSRGATLPGREVALWLDSAAGLVDAEFLDLGGLPVTRIASASPEVLDVAALLARLHTIVEIEVAPDLGNEAWLLAHLALEEPRLVVRPAPRSTLSECRAREVPPERLRELLARSSASVEDLPLCLAGGRPVTWTEPALQPELLDGLGREAVERLVERFGASRYRAKSIRCARCADEADCRGESVQRVRAFGLGSLTPRG